MSSRQPTTALGAITQCCFSGHSEAKFLSLVAVRQKMSDGNAMTKDDGNAMLLVNKRGATTVNVGGTRFQTAASTLMTNSTYFASLFSDNWLNSSVAKEDNNEIFLDQDPIVFAKLLSYMRKGMIRIEDIDMDVLFLAEFLRMERLLLAIKVRWYCNIGKGPVDLESDEAIATAFDEVHGGIIKAISNGLYPSFQEQDNVNAEQDLALLTVYEENYDSRVYVERIVNGAPGVPIECDGIFGALNGLHANGFTSPGLQLDADAPHRCREYITFYRRRHSTIMRTTGDATSILIPTQDEINRSRDNYPKQFVAYILTTEEDVRIIAPAEFIINEADDLTQRDSTNPYNTTIIKLDDDRDDRELKYWLLKHNFTTPETSWPLGLPKTSYISYLGGLNKCLLQIYSRPLKQQQE